MNEPANVSLKGTSFEITNLERIPARRYYDETFYKLECELVWPRVWQMACRLEEIPEIGDFVEYQILDQSVILVRTESEIKAFHNSCRHRGVEVAKGHGNCRVEGFVCPFHGWRYTMNGENSFVFERQLFSEGNLEAASLNLVPCRVELWGGCAFINFDDDAPPLLECIKPVADSLDVRNADKMKVEWWRSTVLPVNWKTAMEAFMEGYHLMKTHPQLYVLSLPAQHDPDAKASSSPRRTFKDSREFIDLTIRGLARLSEGMAGQVHANDVAIAQSLRDIELPDDPAEAAPLFFRRLNDEIVARGRARGVPVPDLNELAVTNSAAAVQFIFPHYFLLPMFGNMSSYRIRPLGPESCLFELWSLTLFPEGETRDRPVAPIPMPHDDPSWPEVPMQDYANLPLQQRGLHAKGFEYMRLSKDVEGLISNYHRLIDGFIEGADRDKLVKATQIACSGLDAPIVDIGF